MSLFFLQNNTSYGFASCVCFLSSLLYTCKTLKPYRTNLQFLLVNVWELYPATDRLIKSFIIYLLPLFVISSKNRKDSETNRTKHTEEEDDFIEVQTAGTEVHEDKIRCTETKQMQWKERNNTDSI